MVHDCQDSTTENIWMITKYRFRRVTVSGTKALEKSKLRKNN